MKNRVVVFLALVILTCALSAQAQVRTWAFSKDTVIESQTQTGTDTVTVGAQKYYFAYSNKISIVNQGAIPLILDSLYVERIQSSFSLAWFRFKVYDSTKNGQISPTLAGSISVDGSLNCPAPGNCGISMSSVSNSLGSIQVQASRNFYNFEMDAPVPVTKRSAAFGVGDTIRYRIIFTAKNDRGRDTLVIRGTQQYPDPSAILPGVLNPKQGKSDPHLFDLRGRRMEPIPEGLMTTPATLLRE
jgi:hypothetical protein